MGVLNCGMSAFKKDAGILDYLLGFLMLFGLVWGFTGQWGYALVGALVWLVVHMVAQMFYLASGRR